MLQKNRLVGKASSWPRSWTVTTEDRS